MCKKISLARLCGIWGVKEPGFDFTGLELTVLFVGTLVSFLVSLFVLRFLMDYIKKHDFKIFGWYRIALGIIVLIYFLDLA